MEIKQNLSYYNPCYKQGKKITVKGLMLHSIGVGQPSGLIMSNKQNKAGLQKAVHAYIDASYGTVYQCLLWTMRGWHAGGSSNNTHIGVEMCEPDCIKYTGGATFTCINTERACEMATTAYHSAVDLFARLCVEFNLNPMDRGVIISHKEGHKMGLASNHADPEHLWKQLGLPYTMDTFREDVNSSLNGRGATEDGSTSEGYKVKVTVSTLNVRKGPGTGTPVTTKIHKGEVYTIVAESCGWGKLKSGAGWIYLKYTQRI